MTTRPITVARAFVLGAALVLASGPAGAQEASESRWRQAGGYTYFATSDPTIEAVKAEYRVHTLDVGLRFGF